jgi:hypothetical protein
MPSKLSAHGHKFQATSCKQARISDAKKIARTRNERLKRGIIQASEMLMSRSGYKNVIFTL